MQRVTGRLPNGESIALTVHRSGDSHVSPTLASTGRWEPFATSIMWSLLGPGDGVIDIGANVGWYTSVLGKRVGSTGWVHSFEPEPRNLALLSCNVADLGLDHVVVHGCALADRASVMALARSEENLGDHRLTSVGRSDRSTIQVPVERLDAVIAESAIDLSRLRVVKIDTQGAETLILRGAADLLRELPSRTALCVEFAPNLLATHGADHVPELIDTVMGLGRPVYALRRASMAKCSRDRLVRLARKLEPLGDEWAVDLFIAPDDRGDRRRLTRFRPPRPVRWV